MPKINIYVSEDLAVQIRQHQVPMSAICQRALREEIERMEATAKDQDFEVLVVETGDGRQRTERFMGRWVVAPDNNSRSSELGVDAGSCYGVADTAKGRIAVWVYHVNDGFAAQLNAYDDIEEAIEGGLPEDIADEYRAMRGEAIWRDI